MITLAQISSQVGSVLVSAGVAGAVSLLTLFVAGQRESRSRRRSTYAEALAVTVAYREFPYAIRRRRQDAASEERIRISEALREVQRDLAFHEAWIRLEASPKTVAAYETLVTQTRRIAGGYMHDAWNAPAAISDADMNILGIDYSDLASPEEDFVSEVRDDLSWRRLWR